MIALSKMTGNNLEISSCIEVGKYWISLQFKIKPKTPKKAN